MTFPNPTGVDYAAPVAASFGADLSSGRYLAVPILDFGADYLAGGQAVLWVP